MTPIDRGKPIRTFVRNLRQWGYRLRVNAAGQLVVTAPADVETSPVLADEIRKRATQIVELLALEQLLDRPLMRNEVERCKQLAKKCGVELAWKRIDLNEVET